MKKHLCLIIIIFLQKLFPRKVKTIRVKKLDQNIDSKKIKETKKPKKPLEQKLLYKGDCNNWAIHLEGIVIRKEDRLLLNGEKLLSDGYDCKWDEYRNHPKGLLIRKGNQFLLILLNGKKLPYKKQQDEKTTEEIMQDLRSRKMKIYLEQEKDKRASQRTRNEKITKEHQKFLQPAEENLQRMIKESKNFKKFIELLFSKEYYHKNYRWEEEGKKKVQIFYNENAIKISIEKNLKILVSKIEIDDDCDGGLDHIKKYLFQLKKEDREEIKKVLEKLSNPEQTIEFLLIESYFEEELIREA